MSIRWAVRGGVLLLLCLTALAPSGCRRRGLPGRATASTEEPLISATPREARGWKKTTVARKLSHPWGLAFLPGGQMLVTERPGRLRLVRGGALLTSPIEGVPAVFAHGQGGLLDIALHPDFQQNKQLYPTYAAGAEESNRVVLARARLDGLRLRWLRVLLDVQPSRGAGASRAAVPGGHLLRAVGGIAWTVSEPSSARRCSG